MDKRSISILYEIVLSPQISDKALLKRFGISKRQLDYSISKINNWLAENEQSLLEKKNQSYEIDQNVLQVMDRELDLSSEYVLSTKERIFMTILHVLSRTEMVTLSILADTLLVSKNTILKDLIEARKLLKEYDLSLEHIRNKGYTIQGDEWNKRLLVKELIQDLSSSLKGLALINEHLEISQAEVEGIRKNLIEAEKVIGLSFTDQTLATLPLIVAFVLRRIESGKLINVDFYLELEELADTREYQVAKHLLKKKFDEISIAEKIYLTLHLLSSQSQNREVLGDAGMVHELTESMKALVKLFEIQSAIMINQKEKLIKKLLEHFIPAYYRIKYKLTASYQFNKNVMNDFQNIYLMVKKSLKPLVDFLGMPVPEEELVFLSLILGGHILGENVEIKEDSRIKAVVVCPNGVTMSQLLEFELARLFPEFSFCPAISIREFNETVLTFDVVFSTVPLKSKEPVYLVASPIEKDDRRLLRTQLEYLIEGSVDQEEIEKLLVVIRKHAVVENESNLRFDIENMLQGKELQPTAKEQNLTALLTEETIQIVETVANWQEVVLIATTPLLKISAISTHYQTELSRKVEDNLAYAVLYSRLAMPHLGPDDGVNQLAMSLLIFKEGLLTPNGQLLHMALVVAPIDKDAHLKGLLEMSDLIQDDASYKQLLMADTAKDVMAIISQLKHKN